MNKGDMVTIMVTTDFGKVPVAFTILADRGNYTYLLMAQDRIVIGQKKVDSSWILSQSIDLLSFPPIGGIYYKQVNP